MKAYFIFTSLTLIFRNVQSPKPLHDTGSNPSYAMHYYSSSPFACTYQVLYPILKCIFLKYNNFPITLTRTQTKNNVVLGCQFCKRKWHIVTKAYVQQWATHKSMLAMYFYLVYLKFAFAKELIYQRSVRCILINIFLELRNSNHLIIARMPIFAKNAFQHQKYFFLQTIKNIYFIKELSGHLSYSDNISCRSVALRS